MTTSEIRRELMARHDSDTKGQTTPPLTWTHGHEVYPTVTFTYESGAKRTFDGRRWHDEVTA